MTRNSDGLRAALILIAMTLHGVAQGSEASQYAVAPPPDWVQVGGSQGTAADSAPVAGAAGTEYLLSDLQVRVDDGFSEYAHFVMRAANASGVDDVANISISFDPAMDRLVLHAVTLRRGSETIDELQQGRIQVLQRESELESGILNGLQTFHLLMSDVRVGDSVDYSYTIERRDPTWGNRFFSSYRTRWASPVQHARVRILTRAGSQPVLWRAPDGKDPIRSEDGPWRSLEWSSDSVPAVAFEKAAPSWYEQYPAVQLSQFASWKDIVDASLPLYALQNPSDPQLATLLGKLGSTAHSDAERALAVVRFVQEEIRYTGLELGSGAFRPTLPAEVLARRYGDCKDKALLAVAMLRALRIDASPALVSTRWGRHLHERLPSPGDFDHAIVRIRLGSKVFWIDVTSTAQGGDLQTGVQADFGEALVIAPGVKGLEEMRVTRPEGPLVSANVEFDLRAGLDKEAGLAISTVYRGSEADSLRRTLRRETPAEIGDGYVKYYKRRYAAIRAVEAPKIADDLRGNQITVNESYRIDGLFEKRDSGKKRFSLEAEIINEHLKSLAVPVRTTPYALEDPVDSDEHIRVLMPESFPVKNDVVKIESPSFHYDSRVSRAGNNVLLDYHYRTLVDTVPRESLDEFRKKRAAAEDDTYFGFTVDADDKPPVADSSEALKQLARAAELAQTGQVGPTEEVLKVLLTSPGFAALAEVQQRAAFNLAGAVALQKGDADRALEVLRRSTALEGAGAGDWKMRLLAALSNQQSGDAVLCLTTLAERWPQSLGELEPRLVARTVHDAPKDGPGRYHLLGALFKADYAPSAFDPSSWWQDLALLHLEHGDRTAAGKALAKVMTPTALVAIRADNRFAPIRDRAGLDVAAALERETRVAREQMKAHPEQLEPVIRLMHALKQSLQFTAALQVADDAVAAMSGPKGPKVYDDYRTYRVWLLDGRAHVLGALGRWDEAVAQLAAARQLPEGNNANVSQTINLAGMYNDIGRPEEALATIALLPTEGASPFGRMQAAIELVASADQRGDAAEVERQLTFLREHRADAVATYQRALVRANRQDAAAQVLISRLEDPNERVDALLELQNYKEPVRGIRAAEWARRWQAVASRADVRAVLHKVGSVSDYPMMASPY